MSPETGTRQRPGQQDSLLPYVESGAFKLVGATTDNPSFELNAALLSRTRVVRLERLSAADIEKIIWRAISDRHKGLAGSLNLDDEAIHMGLSGQRLPHDKHSEEHFNIISAFIKSIRFSGPDAALYCLARMLEAGEDPLFIARRMVVFASEDTGNADLRTLFIALAAKDAADLVGMPEVRINLAQATIYLAGAPKNRACYNAIEAVLREVRETGALPTPLHLRNAVTPLMKAHGYGKG